MTNSDSPNRNKLRINTEPEVDLSSIVLNEKSIEGLVPVVRDDVKKRVRNINQAWEVAGRAIRTVAAELDAIRRNTKQGNWEAVVENDLVFSSSIANDLVIAHQWLSSSQIPNRFLSNISARTLRTIAAEKDAKLKEKITQEIISKEGMGFSEVRLKEITAEFRGGNPKKVATSILNKAKRELKADATKEEILSWYKSEVNSVSNKITSAEKDTKAMKAKNDQLKKEIEALKKEKANLKKQVPSSEVSREVLSAVKEDPSAARLIADFIKKAKGNKESLKQQAKDVVGSL